MNEPSKHKEWIKREYGQELERLFQILTLIEIYDYWTKEEFTTYWGKEEFINLKQQKTNLENALARTQSQLRNIDTQRRVYISEERTLQDVWEASV